MECTGCGQELQGYRYQDQDRDAGIGSYSASQVSVGAAAVFAASRADVLNWRTDFRPAAHDLRGPDGTIFQPGACHAPEL